MSDWNSTQYMKFGEERTQPSIDLINRLSELEPVKVIDLGCGPGNSTHALAQKFEHAEILGVDASQDMLKKAKFTYPELAFQECLLPQGLSSIDGTFDLVFSNACIHWIPQQKELFYTVFDKLNPGGVFAVQIPLIQKAPFYKLLYKIVDGKKWKMLSQIHNFHNLLSEEYYDLLGRLSQSFHIWETVYYHTVSSADDVIEWYKGSGLRPYLDRLSESEKVEFLSDLRQIIIQNYPVRENGNIILKMPRLFFTAIK